MHHSLLLQLGSPSRTSSVLPLSFSALVFSMCKDQSRVFLLVPTRQALFEVCFRFFE
jgi:hypothetical protein